MLSQVASFLFFTCLATAPAKADTSSMKLVEMTEYKSGIFDESAAEIIVYSSAYKQFYLVNGADPSVVILRLQNGQLVKSHSFPLSAQEQPTSVAVYGDLIAVAVHKIENSGRPGKVVFFDPQATRLAELDVGDLPDMVTFSEDGRYILTANEGEPTEISDPDGSVSVITLNREDLANSLVSTVTFNHLKTAPLADKGVRIYPGKTAAEDFEPEYISVMGNTAYVALQENNSIALIDIEQAELLDIWPLGYKDHALPHNGLDTSDKDGKADITPKPIRGMYMPDTIASFTVNGQSYLVSANEGDARDESQRLGKAELDPALQKRLRNTGTGTRLKISMVDGDTDGDGDIDEAYSYGTRSFSIWGPSGDLMFDSGDQFAQTLLAAHGFDGFNHSNNKNKTDNRSDDKGSEPEAIAIGKVGPRTYAFIGLERSSGIMVYDVTSPRDAQFVSYYNDRNFDPDLDLSTPEGLNAAGHLGPESIIFIGAKDSPYGKPTLAVSYEVSGSVVLYTLE